MQKYFNKNRFYKTVNVFYQRIKLKTHFKDQTNKPIRNMNWWFSTVSGAVCVYVLYIIQIVV